MVQAGACCKCEPERARSKPYSSVSTSNPMNSGNGKRSHRRLRAASTSRENSPRLRGCGANGSLPHFSAGAVAHSCRESRSAVSRHQYGYRTTWGMDEDIYLVQLTFPKNGQQVLAWLVNEYSNWAPPIPIRLPRADDGTPFYLVRDSHCDLPYGELLLRTAPWDPMAILPERLVYRPRLKKIPESGEVLPCYRTEEHKSGRIVWLLSAIVFRR
jgi:hypothetical protein